MSTFLSKLEKKYRKVEDFSCVYSDRNLLGCSHEFKSIQNLRTYKPPTKDQLEPMKKLTEEEIEQWKQAEISVIEERMG